MVQNESVFVRNNCCVIGMNKCYVKGFALVCEKWAGVKLCLCFRNGSKWERFVGSKVGKHGLQPWGTRSSSTCEPWAPRPRMSSNFWEPAVLRVETLRFPTLEQQVPTSRNCEFPNVGSRGSSFVEFGLLKVGAHAS